MSSAAPDLSHSQNNPASPLATPFFRRGTPFSPAPAACHCEVPWQILTLGPISASGLITKGIARIAPSMAWMNSHRLAVPSSPASACPGPDCAIARPPSLTHAPHSTARRARFGPCPVSGLYSIQRLLFAALGRPGGPHYSCWNIVSKSAWPVSVLLPGASRSSHGDTGPILE